MHPVRAIFEVCGTLLFAVPFLAAFAMTRSAPLYLYLLYPLLFLVSHFVWFRLPSVDRRVRWFLFWLTLTLVAALGAGFMFWSYWEAAARGRQLPAAGHLRHPALGQPEHRRAVPHRGCLLPGALRRRCRALLLRALASS